MSGEIPKSIQTTEARSALTPREGLEKFLETEKLGSIKGQALADRALSEVLENRMKKFANKHKTNPDLPISREEHLAMAQYTAFSETHRTRRFGETAQNTPKPLQALEQYLIVMLRLSYPQNTMNKSKKVHIFMPKRH